MSERKVRSLMKAATWRIVATADTVLVAFLVTGEVKSALAIGTLEVFTKMGIYYVHERGWNRVRDKSE